MSLPCVSAKAVAPFGNRDKRGEEGREKNEGEGKEGRKKNGGEGKEGRKKNGGEGKEGRERGRNDTIHSPTVCRKVRHTTQLMPLTKIALWDAYIIKSASCC